MVRQRPQRQSLEELYNSKYETTKSIVQSTNATAASGTRTMRADRETGYIINSNMPYNYMPRTAEATSSPYVSMTNKTVGKNNTMGSATARRKTARPADNMKAEKSNTDKDEDTSKKDVIPPKSRNNNNSKYSYRTNNSVVDNKLNMPSYMETGLYPSAIADQSQHHPHSHQYQHNKNNSHHHHPHNHHQQHNHHNHHNTPVSHRNTEHDDEDKDDDTEEFFQIIKQTVENAVGMLQFLHKLIIPCSPYGEGYKKYCSLISEELSDTNLDDPDDPEYKPPDPKIRRNISTKLIGNKTLFGDWFEIVKRKSISELLNRNFRDLSMKVERFSADLLNTNALLNQMQSDINKKIIHYGEENSRHFRYLCMKSEYDKMFYQHQAMVNCGGGGASAASSSSNPMTLAMPQTFPKMPAEPVATSFEKRKPSSKTKHKQSQNKEIAKSTTYAPEPVPAVSCANKSSSDEQSLSQKSSEIGMREILEHIQKFCNQMNLSDVKCDPSCGLPQMTSTTSNLSKRCSRSEGNTINFETGITSSSHTGSALHYNKDIFLEDEEDDFDVDVIATNNDMIELSDASSDGMTPRMQQNIKKNKYNGAMTARGGPSTSRAAAGNCKAIVANNGGGGGAVAGLNNNGGGGDG